jgi:hypothetical protein
MVQRAHARIGLVASLQRLRQLEILAKQNDPVAL